MLFGGRHEVIKNNKMKLQRRKKAFNTLQKKRGKKMNFLEYVNKDSEGLVFIDKIRNVIKELCNKGIREEFKYVTEDDIDKLTLMLECNFFSGITAEDSEWDLNTITIDEVQFLIDTNIGFFSLLKAIEKNKRESYSELLDDVVYNAIGCIENIDKACEYSNNIKNYYLMSIGEYEEDYFAHSDNEILDTLKDVYKFMLKDKIEF